VFGGNISFEIRSMWGIPKLDYIPTILRASRAAAAGFQFEYSKSLDKGAQYQSASFQIGLCYIRGKERMACGPLRVVTG
jgi:hypothetical protein